MSAEQAEEEPPKAELEWPMDKVRSTFINFYRQKHGHTYWPSSPCVPVDDPTLLFANAGMNQYKPLFLGTCDPNLKMSQLKRAVNSQKCIRAGGKHNDLDDVGKDVYHHTFFEMLGSWSFGAYFKEGAIGMAWSCLIDEFKLDPARIYASYYAGDENTPADEEARQIWLQYLPANRILPFGAEDNFWEMGATGPCGPCTEIHYDRIGGRDASKLVNADVPDVIEIWNVVFIQYNRESDGSLRPLPAQHVDTGLGFERLTSILQGVDSNYDTDIFIPLFDAIQKITGARPYSGKIGTDDIGYVDMAYRVIADHIRTLSFAIADGCLPSNDGRGYVLRRVLRRAVRYGRQNLGAELGFFSKLVPVFSALMGKTFPELITKKELVESIINDEEKSFSRTLDKGLLKFNELAQKVGEDKVFSGEDAHFLYTSMGFPVDLTELMAEEKGLSLDKAGFENKMEYERQLSNAARLAKTATGSGKDMRLVAEQTSCLVGKGVKKTDDAHKYIRNTDCQDCVVKAVFLGRNETEDNIGFVDTITTESSTIGIILDKTSFYAEQGGQTFDTGVITSSNGGAKIRIDNVQIYGQYVLHVGEVVAGAVSIGDTVTCTLDYTRRAAIESNHTMTHVLNYALKEVLVSKPKRETGKVDSTTGVDQKGSLVDASKLRFDFSWNSQLTPQQLADVETICAQNIATGVPVESYVAPLQDAERISSLRAVFGEKYPDPVRVVSIAPESIKNTILVHPEDAKWNDYSMEFCGGTHLANTNEAAHIVLLSEEGIAKGIRRIIAVTMDEAKQAIARADAFEAKVAAASKLDEAKLEEEVKLLKVELNELTISATKKIQFRTTVENEFMKRIMKYKKEKAAGMTDEIVKKVIALAGAESSSNRIICRFDFGTNGKVAKSVTQQYGKKVKDKALMIISLDAENDRFLVMTFAPKGMKDGVDCKAWATAAIEGTGGKGGGKKDSAQYTVVGASHLDAVLEKAHAFP